MNSGDFIRHFFIFLVTFANSAFAQVSLDELDAAAEVANSSVDAFSQRLNDPDPDPALAALQLLVTKSDADQRRMAIRHGLQSTYRAIQATTVRAIQDFELTLRVVMDPSAKNRPSTTAAASTAQVV